MLEEARALGELLKQGWRPKRTIIYCAWDGEEPGLLGSTEWAETHADELSRNAVVYINSDSNGRGFWDAGGVALAREVHQRRGRDIEDPETHVSVVERLVGARSSRRIAPSGGSSPIPGRRDAGRAGLAARTPIAALGSGSDYTVFIDHLGIAVANLGFGGEDRRRDLPLDLRRLLLVHAFLRYAISSTGGRSRRPPGRPCCASPTPTCCRSISRRSPTPSRGTSGRSAGRPRRSGPPREKRTARSTRGCSRQSTIRAGRRSRRKRRRFLR